MEYKLNKAYEVNFSKIRYMEQEPLYQSPYNSFNIVVVEKEVTNRHLFFSYYTKRISTINLYNAIGTLNESRAIIAGVPIAPKSAVISNVIFERKDSLLDGNSTYLWKVSVDIEIEQEKSLKFDKIPLKSSFFKNPVSKSVCPIQFTVSPADFDDKIIYPMAYHVGGGYGFFSEERSDLNVQEEMFVTSNGNIVGSIEDIEYYEIKTRSTFDWTRLGFPIAVGN